MRRAGPEVSDRGRRRSTSSSAMGETGDGVRRVEGRGTGGGRGARSAEPRLLRCSRCARRCEKCGAGRRAAGQRLEPGLSGTGARESRTHQGAPAEPDRGGRRAAPRPGARQPPGRLRRAENVRLHGKAVLFCLLAPRLRRSVYFLLPEIFAVV